MIRAPWPKGYHPDRPFQWSPSELNLMGVWCAAMIEDLSAAQPDLFRRLVDWTPGGISTASGERVSGGEHGSSPTARFVVNTKGADPIVRDARVLVNGWSQMASLLEQMWTAHKNLSIAERETVAEVMQEKPRPGAGECGNPRCKHWCSGVGEDRLKAGRCPKCLTYRGKNGVERPHEVCHDVEVGGCELCTRAA